MNSDKSILIFAGAGASKAVAPDVYPTTIEFFNGLPTSVKSNPLFAKVENFIKQTSDSEQIDIELILWQLQELREFCTQVTDQSQLSGWMLAGNRLISALPQSANLNIGNLSQIADSAAGGLDSLISEINARVYGLYSKLPTQEQLETTWTPLLGSLAEFGAQIEIVTTNYDVVIESALVTNEVVDNGWRGNVVRNIETGLWAVDSSSRKKGLLTKLHGSVNWTRDGDNLIYVSDPLFKGSHDSHVIIYPGFKGRPSDPTFQAFHNHFRKRLESATVVIFIGFAFRDEYINEICERSINAQTSTSVINPEKVDLPFESNHSQYIEAPFDEEAVSAVVEFSKRAMGV